MIAGETTSPYRLERLLKPSRTQNYDPAAGWVPRPTRRITTQAYIKYVGVVPTQATKLYE